MLLFVTRISYPAVEFAGNAPGPVMVTKRLATAGGAGGGGAGWTAVAGAAGVTEFDGNDGRLPPTALMARTTNV